MQRAPASSRSSGWRRRRTTRSARSIRGSWPRSTAPTAGRSSRAGTCDGEVPWGPTEASMDYAAYKHLTFERKPHGVVLITIDRPDVLNATNDRLHWELTQIWPTLDADDSARVAGGGGGARIGTGGGQPPENGAEGRDPPGGAPQSSTT